MPTRTLSLIDRLLAAYEQSGTLPAIGGGDHGDPPSGDPPAGDPPNPPKSPKFEWNDEEMAEIRRIAAKEAGEAARKAREQRDAEIEAERKAAEAEAERKKQEAAGEFEAVKTSLSQERDTAIRERDTLKADYDAITGYFSTQYDAAIKELPEFVTAFKPEDDATFQEKADWLAKAQEQARKLDKQTARGNGPDPKPGAKQIDDKQARAQARRAMPRL